MDPVPPSTVVSLPWSALIGWGISVATVIGGSVSVQIHRLRTTMDRRLERLEDKVGTISVSHANLEGRTDGLDSYVGKLDERLTSLERDCPLRGPGGKSYGPGGGGKGSP